MISLIKAIDHILLMTPAEKQEDERKAKKDVFANFADSIVKAEEEDAAAKKDILREGIAEREKKDKGAISRSRVITSRLSQMRQKADLSPFVGTSGKIKSPKIRRGEFMEILAREVLYIGNEEMEAHGGVVGLSRMKEYFEEKRDNWQLRKNDISEAVDLLIDAKLIAGKEDLGDEVIIYFKAIELSHDPKSVIQAAFGIEATYDRLLQILGWSKERLKQAIDQLIQDGIAIDDGTQIYFPGLS